MKRVEEEQHEARQRKKVRGMDLPLATLPPQTTHTHTIIFLHGRGDTAANLAETFFWSRSSPSFPPGSAAASDSQALALARRARGDGLPALDNEPPLPLNPPSFAAVFHNRVSAKFGRPLSTIFPSVRWVFPQAPKRPCEQAGGTPMNQWFDIWNILDFEDREELQIPGLAESIYSLRNLVWDEAWTLGGLDADDADDRCSNESRCHRYDSGARSGSRSRSEDLQYVRARYKRGLRRIILAGISQGGATAAHAFINLGSIPTRGTDASADSTSTGSSSGATTTGDDTEMMDLDEQSPPTPVSDPGVVDMGHVDPKTEGGQGGDSSDDGEPLRLAAFVGFSAILPLSGGTLEETREVLALDRPLAPSAPGAGDADSIVRHTPVLLEHCEDDPLIFVEYGKQLREGLRGFGCDAGVEWIQYPDGGHWINAPRGIDDLAAFLKRQGLEEAKENRAF